MARITFAQAKSLLASTVTSRGPTDPSVALAINFVQDAFLKSPERYKGSQTIIRLACNALGIIALPTAIENIDSLSVATTPDHSAQFVNVQSPNYLFDEESPGYKTDVSPNPGPYSNTVVKLPSSQNATQYDPPVPQTIRFTADGSDTTPLELHIKALDENGNPIYTAGVEGFDLTLDPTATTTVLISAIYQITKIKSNSAIQVECVDIGGQIGLIFPQETNPEYQRYKVMGSLPESRTFYGLCTKAFVILTNDDDLVQIPNINALRYGMQAYRYEGANDLERANLYWGAAYKALDKELATNQTGQNEHFNVQLKGFMSPIKNLI